MKKFTSALAVVMSLLMILCSLPFSVMANPTTTAYEKIGDTTTIADGTPSSYVDGVMAAANFSNGNYYQRNATFYDSVASTKSLDGGKVFKNALASNGKTVATAAHNFGFMVDVFTPTISNVNGIALWVDFSEFEYDDYWRILANDTTADDARAAALNTATTSPTSTGAHTAYLGGRGSSWSTDSTSSYYKTGKLTLINTVTGEITKDIEFTKPAGIGAYRIPAGFVGYAYFEFDNKTNEGQAAMSLLGSIGFYRRNDGVAAATSTDTTVSNLNQLSNNSYTTDKPVFYYVGDVMAVSDIDVFAADVVSGKLGKLQSSGCGAALADKTVTVDVVPNATKYVATALNEADGFKLVDYAESTTNVLTFTEDVTGKYIQVIAYDATGKILKVVSTHNFISFKKDPTVSEDGYTADQCVVCKAENNKVVIPALGLIGLINGASDNTEVIQGRQSPITYAAYDPELAYTGASSYGPSVKYVLQDLTPWGGVAANLDLEYANGFAFYIDVNGSAHCADEFAENNHVAANNYFDVYFGTELHANFGDDEMLGTGFEELTGLTAVIGNFGDNRNNGIKYGPSAVQKFNWDITFKLYDVKTGTLTEGTYNEAKASNGTSGFPRAEMIIPEGFTGYVIVDLSDYKTVGYTGGAPDINSIKQIYVERSSDLVPTDAEGNEYADGQSKVAYDNFFPIYDIDTVAASAESFENIITEYGTAYPAEGYVFETAMGDDRGNYEFRVEGFTPAQYRIYRTNASGDTLILEETVDAVKTGDNYTYFVEEGNIIYLQPIDADGKAGPVACLDSDCYHEWGDEIDDGESTCDQYGYRYHVCGKCDDWLILETYPLADHEYDEVPDDSAEAGDCQHPATETYMCLNCGYEDIRIVGPAGEHTKSGEGVVTPPTATEEGYTTYTCEVCGESFRTDFVAGGTLDEQTGFEYLASGEGVEIIGYEGTATEITIPAEIAGKEVVSIAKGAFIDDAFTVVTLNATVTTSGTNVDPVFMQGQNMIVNVGAGVKSIPAYLFCGVRVSELNFAADATITSIGIKAFEGNRIVTLELPDSLEVIEGHAFRGAINLKTLKTGKNLREIGEYAFALSYKLETIEFAEGLHKLDNLAFYKASTMAAETVEVLLPHSLAYYAVSNHAFKDANVTLKAYKNSYADLYIEVAEVVAIDYYYKLLDEANFTTAPAGDDVIITGYNFADIAETGLGKTVYAIEIPATIGGKTVVGIGEKAFFNGNAQRTIKAIKLPETVTSIGKQAFRAWISLEEVYAPSVNEIGYWAFILSGKVAIVDMQLVGESTIDNEAFNAGWRDTITFK